MIPWSIALPASLHNATKPLISFFPCAKSLGTFRLILERLSFDRGFHSPENQKELSEIVPHLWLPKPGGKQSIVQLANADDEFLEAQQNHPGVESAIGALQSGNGMQRCRDRSEPGFERYVSLPILGRTVAAKRVDFGYNTGGMQTEIKRYNDLAGTQIVANSTFTYDLLGRTTALDHKNAAGGNLANYTWTFDADRRITNFTNADGSSDYSYDVNDQVTVVDHSYQTDESYTYGANGNRTNTGYSTGTNNHVTSDGAYNYTYDDEGNRISRTKISDSTTVEYTWDYRNRLTDVVYKNGSGTVTKKVQYQYDVFNRRIGKKVDANGDGTYETGTYWVYDDAGKTRCERRNAAGRHCSGIQRCRR